MVSFVREVKAVVKELLEMFLFKHFVEEVDVG
jgi:hypothetical protein